MPIFYFRFLNSDIFHLLYNSKTVRPIRKMEAIEKKPKIEKIEKKPLNDDTSTSGGDGFVPDLKTEFRFGIPIWSKNPAYQFLGISVDNLSI